MAFFTFVADSTIPGLSAKDLARRASDSITTAKSSTAQRQAFSGANRALLRDLGLDRGAC